MIISKPPDQLAKEDLIRQTLEAAANRIEELAGNATYRQAWKIAIRAIRSMPLVRDGQFGTNGDRA